MMGFMSPQILLLLINAVILATQELVTLNVSPVITAECGKQVTLTCNATSNRPGLSIKHLIWIKNNKSLCGVNKDGNITEHPTHTPSDFHCEYEPGQLSLIFKQVQPVESGASADYMCKLRSNHGLLNKHAQVELQACCGTVEATMTSAGPNCTFTKVHPDADVHWFLGSHNLTGGSPRRSTTKHVEESGWMTVHSHLEKEDSGGPYSCSLWCPRSGQYITSSLVPVNSGTPNRITSGTTAQRAMKTFWFISGLLAVMMK